MSPPRAEIRAIISAAARWAASPRRSRVPSAMRPFGRETLLHTTSTLGDWGNLAAASTSNDESQPLIAEVLGIDYAAVAHLSWPLL
ncbi:hypothetical protein ABT115_20735 [Streptomyces sp. NPDC001832]|uniref:hypothetical protein n=1 Tax=Streptomyces sp. NPDC001832 TaxID=3154527 RepID=UPI00332C97D5